MVDLYVEKGIPEEDATTIINLMAKHKDFFIDHMMIQVSFLLTCPKSTAPGIPRST